MIVFFVRRFNDIDHMTPVISKIAEHGEHDVMVLSLDPSYNMWKNPCIVFLKTKFNITFDYIYNIYKPTKMHSFLAFLMCSRYSHNSWWRSLRRFFRKDAIIHMSEFFAQCCFDIVRKIFCCNLTVDRKKKYYHQDWAEGFLKRFGVQILIFDWVKNYQNVTGSLIAAANKMKIPTVGLPNGGMVWTVNSWEKEDVSIYGESYLFDFIVSPNENAKKVFIKGGISPERSHVLGSARFCSEWMNVYPNVYLGQQFISKQNDKSKLRVVYMEGGIKVLSDKKALIKMIREISSLDFIDLVIKPKSRSNRLQILELACFGQVTPNVSSFLLCKWADVVIVGISSIYLEVLGQKKVLLYPKFLFRRTVHFEQMGVAWIVNEHKEMIEVLYSLKNDLSSKPYSERAVENLFTEIVNGGVVNRDVLGEYRDFILEKVKRRDHYQEKAIPYVKPDEKYGNVMFRQGVS